MGSGLFRVYDVWVSSLDKNKIIMTDTGGKERRMRNTSALNACGPHLCVTFHKGLCSSYLINLAGATYHVISYHKIKINSRFGVK